MDFYEEVRFSSAPALVRTAVIAYIQSHYPVALSYIQWDTSKRHADASRMGASGTLELSGTNSTLMILKGRIGFPASMAVSEAQVKTQLKQAIRDIKSAAS